MWKLFSSKPAISSAILKELCPKDELEAFSPLDAYFSTLKLKHFYKADLGKLAENVPERHRLLMTLFVENYLRPCVEQHQGSGADEYASGAENGIDCSDGVFDARGCLVSSIYEVDNIAGRMNIRKLQDEAYLRQVTDKTAGFSMLDFTNNDLESAGKIKPNCQILLKNNRIHGSGEYKEKVPRILRELADLSHVSFIDIQNNPFCTIERMDFWRSLRVDENLTGKVVWINRYILNSSGWNTLVDNELVCQKMREVHQDYYDK
ncbi:hypothetical protein MP638_007222 [Amoeboaphelidium occidentale]|nr:hypothetical protein MP638_007222 [Amoeboaphelidium occidentale]